MYKIVNKTKLDNDLASVTQAIQTVDGSSENLEFPSDYVDKISQFYTIDDFTDLSKPEGALYSEAVSIGWNYCCYGRTGITSLNFPNLTFGTKQAFMKCTSITQVYLPKIQALGESFINGSPLLTQVVLPSNWWIGNYGLISTGLINLDMGYYPTPRNDKGIATYGLYGCSNLNLLIIRCNEVIPLLNVTGLGNTPFASGKAGGTLYVPQSLISEYQNATNWSTILSYTKNDQLQNQILSIEGSIYETKYADGSVINGN